MVNVVGVRFRNAGKVYYFDPGDIELSEGGKVIVETVRGLECGEVVVEPRPVPEEEITQPLRKVVRKASPEDEATVEANREKERKAFKIGLEKIEAHGLPMKLVDVEYAFDGSKIIFFFTADGRVDFRELVKDLAGVFRTRIELRQIGVRDEAKMLGGLGPCGRPLCCATFLKDFEPVSIRMAKDQNLSLNPTKISGICGRLMCCLKYEHCVYKDLRQDLPPLGSEIDTGAGVGKVVELDVLKGIATVKMPDGKTVHVDARSPEASCCSRGQKREIGPCKARMLCEAANKNGSGEDGTDDTSEDLARECGNGATAIQVGAADGVTAHPGQTATAGTERQSQSKKPRRRRRRQKSHKPAAPVGSRRVAATQKPGSRVAGSGADRRTGTNGTGR